MLPAAVAAALAPMVGRWRPRWSRRRVIASAALPLPTLAAGLAVFLIVSSATASAAQCGVDACGMATVIAMFILAYAAGAFLLGAIAAAAVLGDRRPR